MSFPADSRHDERDVWVILTFFLVALAFSFVSLTGSWPRYVMYLMPGVVVFLALSGNRNRPITIDLPVGQLMLLYCLAAFLPTIYQEKLSFFTLRDFLLIAIPMLTFTYWFYVPEKAIKVLFWGLIVVQVFNLFAQLHYGTSIDTDVSLSESKGVAESSLGGPLAAMAIFFICRGRYGYGLGALLAAFIGFKRISFVGLVISLLIYLALRFLDSDFRKAKPGAPSRPGPLSKMTLVVFTIICVVLSRNINELIVYLDGLFDLYDSHPEQILLGRYMLSNLAFKHLLDVADLWQTLFGFGIGVTSITIQQLSDISLLHNDLLKIQAEYGAIGLLLILVGWWRVFCRTHVGMALYAYTLVLWLTDNTLIYVFHGIVMLLLVRFDYQSQHMDGPVPEDDDRQPQMQGP